MENKHQVRIPKVSVIIPTYNREDFLAEAIQSVLDQTFRDLKIIVIDDGSTDNTREVVDSFKDPRIKYIYQENQGVCIARNTAVNNSNSEYIAFLDSDDVLLKEAIEKEVHVLDEYPEAGLGYGQAYLIDTGGRVFGLYKHYLKYSCIRTGSDVIKEFLIHGYSIPSPTIMTRRSCLNEVGLYSPDFHHGSEDFDLMVRLCKNYTVVYIAEPLAKYRVHATNQSSGHALEERERSNSRILESIFNDAELGTSMYYHRSKAYFHLYRVLAYDAYSSRQMKTARRYILKAIRVHPKGFLKGFDLLLVLLFIKTLLPLSLLSIASRAKSYLYRSTKRFSKGHAILTGVIRNA